jgi:hypothetical protein
VAISLLIKIAQGSARQREPDSELSEPRAVTAGLSSSETASDSLPAPPEAAADTAPPELVSGTPREADPAPLATTPKHRQPNRKASASGAVSERSVKSSAKPASEGNQHEKPAGGSPLRDALKEVPILE